jgi:hypothetical protein
MNKGAMIIKVTKEKLTFEKVKFLVHLFAALSFISELIKFIVTGVEWSGWASIWAFILGLNWVLGTMAVVALLMPLCVFAVGYGLLLRVMEMAVDIVAAKAFMAIVAAKPFLPIVAAFAAILFSTRFRNAP